MLSYLLTEYSNQNGTSSTKNKKLSDSDKDKIMKYLESNKIKQEFQDNKKKRKASKSPARSYDDSEINSSAKKRSKNTKNGK